MAYNFPDNPVQDQEFTPPGGNQPTYIWQTPRWIIKGVPPANSGGIVDAPNDGQQYGRQSAGWTVVAPIPTWTTLAGKPATFPPTVPIAWTDISGKPATFPPTVPIAWTDISGKPATFPPPIPSVSTLGGVFSYTAPANEYLIGISTSGQPVSAPITGIPSASGATPVMDGAGAAGVAVQWSRGDHVHPSDTSRVAKTGDTMTGNLYINSNLPTLLINKQLTSGQTAAINGRVAGLDRWIVALGDSAPESGGNSGSNFTIQRYNDAGVVMDNPLSITRSNGIVAVNSLYSLATVYENAVALGSTYHRIIPRYNAIVSSATPTPDANTTDLFGITAQAVAATIAAPANTTPAMEGQKLTIRIKDNGTAQTLAWNAAYRAGLDLALPLVTVAGRTMYCAFMYNSVDAKWDYVAQTGGF